MRTCCLLANELAQDSPFAFIVQPSDCAGWNVRVLKPDAGGGGLVPTMVPTRKQLSVELAGQTFLIWMTALQLNPLILDEAA